MGTFNDYLNSKEQKLFERRMMKPLIKDMVKAKKIKMEFSKGLGSTEKRDFLVCVTHAYGSELFYYNENLDPKNKYNWEYACYANKEISIVIGNDRWVCYDDELIYELRKEEMEVELLERDEIYGYYIFEISKITKNGVDIFALEQGYKINLEWKQWHYTTHFFNTLQEARDHIKRLRKDTQKRPDQLWEYKGL